MACPVQIPIGSEDNFKGVVDLVKMKALIWDSNDLGENFKQEEIPEDLQVEAQNRREEMISILSDYDDQLAEDYLEGRELCETKVISVIRSATVFHQLVPVLCGAAFKNKGVNLY